MFMFQLIKILQKTLKIYIEEKKQEQKQKQTSRKAIWVYSLILHLHLNRINKL